MSVYTTEVRYICETSAGLKESVGASSVDEVIDKALDKVFNFNFPIFDEAYRSILEHKILKHYYTREIGEETVGLWQLRLNTKLNEIMPYYNQLYKSELLSFNPLYTFDITRTHETTRQDVGNNNGSNSTSASGNTQTAYSDTPQGTLGNLEDNTYLTSASKQNSGGYSSGTSYENTRLDSTESYLERVQGFEGVNGSKLLLDFRQTFLNIDMLVIGELETLFMGLW